ncbi:MAG: hypothetical protein FWE62_02520, partial [Firmicutes bacterium]|nr:hypothetical protein [Bacillota bacterium]
MMTVYHKTKRNRSVFKAAVAVITAFILLTGIIPRQSGRLSAEDGAFENVTLVSSLEPYYTLGTQLEIPYAFIHYDGGSVLAAQATVYYPSGAAVRSGSVALFEPGCYTAEYSALVGSKPISAKTSFVVRAGAHTVSSMKSSVRYGTVPSAPASPGVVLNLARGDTYHYNRVIDFSGNTEADTVIKFFAVPKNNGAADANGIRFRFTDIYDPTNYVDISVRTIGDPWAVDFTYVHAAPAGEPLASAQGMDGNYTVVKTGYYGHSCFFNLRGGADGANPFEFSWDYAQQRLYSHSPLPYFEEGVWLGYNTTLVADLRGEDFYSKPWAGFTSGEAFLTVEPYWYSENSASYVITEINGQDLSKDIVDENRPPVLTVDNIAEGYLDDALPAAAVGKPYRVFGASAFDPYTGSVPVYTEVYYNYYSAGRSLVQIENGAFTPKRAGTYTIVYATHPGNKTEKVLHVTADDNGGDFDFTLKSPTQNADSGTYVQLFGGITPLNNRGADTYDVWVTDDTTGAEYPVGPDWKFFPMDAGAYTVTVVGSDYISEKTQTFPLSVSPGGTPAILEQANLPRYFIRNAVYTLPKVTGYVFSSGKAVPTAADVAVFENGTTPAAVTGGKYTVGNCSTVTVVYTLTAGGVTSAPQTHAGIPVVNTGHGGNLTMSNYFQPVAGTFTSSSSSTDNTYTAATKDTNNCAALEFVNPVQMSDFSFTLNTVSGKTGMRFLNVYLTDAADPDNTLKISFFAATGGSEARLNDGTGQSLGIDFNTPGSGSFAVKYRGFSRAVSMGGATVPAQKNLAGQPFTGFKSDKAFLKIELAGISGAANTAAVKIVRLNNQPFYSSILGVQDNIAPEYIVSEQRGERRPGDVLYLPPAAALDVLDPAVTLVMRVLGPDGKAVVSDDGVTLDEANSDPSRGYYITLGSYGAYTVRYRAEDSRRAAPAFSYNILVVNRDKPVITLGTAPATAKVGGIVQIAAATVSGGLTATVWLERP